ncbi:triacylglycerol lipase [Saccharopolyspora erythraea NRRL 2338]|uniref:Lipase family protein n=1 Tax=Saccharopolyspora erythraea TaxID=1836 RepID=A0ABN1DRA4_SACER|nr:lipase family protein [Saccharopolyspora erythraea]EQD84480.1 triacylglycerol lipase [Saccharopolyspora erythraea D]PFG95416.1 triacylglycerol lipase [Saccharopolyspora erythraea NRRL 2338]QRK92054.1 triacylglycerol lipase [Saccharopolyspora erythraea]
MRRALAPAAALTIAFAAMSPAAMADAAGRGNAPCSATDEQIYTPPVQPAGAPGDVLACLPAEFPKIPGQIPKRSWKLQYRSTDINGAPVAVSGMLAVPEAPWPGPNPRPVVAFNPGTLGLGPQCAYSKQMSGAHEDAYEIEQLAAALKAGYAVVATDGMGYLNGQRHPYMVGQNAGHALLDAVRAASRLPESGIDPAAPAGLWGYSEGGQAALWATQLAASYAPELNIAGTAAGGVPGDLRVVGNALNGGQYAGFAAAALVGFHVGYPRMPFDELLNDNGRQAVAKLSGSCLIDTIFGFAKERVEDYTTEGLTVDEIYALPGPDGTTWGQIADRHKLGVGIGAPGSGAQYEIEFPVFQYRGAKEQIIPVETEERTRTAYCEAGIPTRWKPDVDGDHLIAAKSAIPDVMAWFGDRFAGAPAPDDCGR